MVKKVKTEVDRLLLVPKIKESSILAKYIGILLFLIKTKSSLSTSVFTRVFIYFAKFRKQYFMYFGYKGVESEPNYSHLLATFLKYHKP